MTAPWGKFPWKPGELVMNDFDLQDQFDIAIKLRVGGGRTAYDARTLMAVRLTVDHIILAMMYDDPFDYETV